MMLRRFDTSNGLTVLRRRRVRLLPLLLLLLLLLLMLLLLLLTLMLQFRKLALAGLALHSDAESTSRHVAAHSEAFSGRARILSEGTETSWLEVHG